MCYSKCVSVFRPKVNFFTPSKKLELKKKASLNKIKLDLSSLSLAELLHNLDDR